MVVFQCENGSGWHVRKTRPFFHICGFFESGVPNPSGWQDQRSVSDPRLPSQHRPEGLHQPTSPKSETWASSPPMEWAPTSATAPLYTHSNNTWHISMVSTNASRADDRCSTDDNYGTNHVHDIRNQAWHSRRHIECKIFHKAKPVTIIQLSQANLINKISFKSELSVTDVLYVRSRPTKLIEYVL